MRVLYFKVYAKSNAKAQMLARINNRFYYIYYEIFVCAIVRILCILSARGFVKIQTMPQSLVPLFDSNWFYVKGVWIFHSISSIPYKINIKWTSQTRKLYEFQFHQKNSSIIQRLRRSSENSIRIFSTHTQSNYESINFSILLYSPTLFFPSQSYPRLNRTFHTKLFASRPRHKYETEFYFKTGPARCASP